MAHVFVSLYVCMLVFNVFVFYGTLNINAIIEIFQFSVTYL